MCIHAIHDVDKICMIRREQRCSLQFLAAAVVIMNKVSLSRTHDDISYFSLTHLLTPWFAQLSKTVSSSVPRKLCMAPNLTRTVYYVHTIQSPCSIIWYRASGVISLAGKVTAGLVESGDSQPSGLRLMSPVG